MSNYVQDSYAYLREKLIEVAGTKIEIYRNGESLGEFDAVFARTRIYDVEGSQRDIYQFVFDFIVRGDVGYQPEKGDRIYYNKKRYVVRAINKEFWRFDDPYETMIRIHTQEEK